MADTKHFIVIGLGSFGTALAERLCKNGCRVTGVDAGREPVEELKDILYEAIIGDATERETLEHLAMKDAKAVFISLGEDITQSLLATLHAKELGASPHHRQRRHARACAIAPLPGNRSRHLSRDRNCTGAGRPNDVAEHHRLSADRSGVQFRRDRCAGPFCRTTLQQLDLRRKFGVWVVGIKDALSGKLSMFPDGDFQLSPDQLLLLVGKQTDVENCGKRAETRLVWIARTCSVRGEFLPSGQGVEKLQGSNF